MVNSSGRETDGATPAQTGADPADLDGIAIIGMDGRFPGANSTEEFWQNLTGGVESIKAFTDEELLAAGVPLATINDPNYVKAGSVLSDIDHFDAAFFGISPREAKSMDPQHRILLECAWGALEDAGYNSETYDGRIGVYTGTSLSTYLHHNLLENEEFLKLAGGLQIEIGNDKDFVPTRISYKMNLTGPSLSINAACSSSLVSVHVACQGLLDQECDMALAGGATIQVPHGKGYWYQPDGIESPDGHCRPFDANAQGTIFGSGVGMVVLKRLEDAVADRDPIYAVIRGSAINNDGALKVGYTAPSVDGQAEAIAEAQAIADVDPETISYIETHGTGTGMGDPIEMTALSQVFGAETDKKGFCAIGSVKGNIGHLNRAAGIIGLIKTALALKHKQLPPSLHFEKANPLIDFERSPFYVNTALQDWQSNGSPRRAGVSSFGIGGTNAHAVLEEAPRLSATGAIDRPNQLLVLSAKTQSALETATQNLAEHLKQTPELTASVLADTAFTLAVGRQAFNHRRIVVAKTGEDAIASLEAPQAPNAFTGKPGSGSQSVVFMFSGQGSQYVNMARGLYEQEPVFRDEVDRCAQVLQPLLNLDLRQLIYPDAEQAETAAEKLQQTAITQPALFVIEYAVAKLWMDWGIEPAAMIGHSIGEYVAATLAGVFSLEDALALVAARGQMMQDLPAGSMLAVFLPQAEIMPLLTPELALATSNSPKVSSLSVSHADFVALEQRLQAQGVEYRRLKTSHAFHSQMMEPILEDFTARVAQLTLNPPQRPYISNVTGTWITAAEATTPGYWAKHLRQTVRFSEGLELLLQEPDRVLLEVGPGPSLRSLAKQQPAAASCTILASVRHPKEEAEDDAILLQTLGQLWIAGVEIDWNNLYDLSSHQRLTLPTYPFERKRFWVDPEPKSATVSVQLNQLLEQSDVSAEERSLLQKLLGRLEQSEGTTSDTSTTYSPDWLYQLAWQPQPQQTLSATATAGTWLILADQSGVGKALAEQLTQHNQQCALAYAGDGYTALADNTWQLNPNDAAQFEQLLNDVISASSSPFKGVLHLWSLDTPSTSELTAASLTSAQALSTGSALHLVQALSKNHVNAGASNRGNNIAPKVWLLTQNAMPVGESQVSLSIAQSPIWGLGKVVALEHATLWGGLIDLGQNPNNSLSAITTEILTNSSEDQLAFRNTERYVSRLASADIVNAENPEQQTVEINSNGTYLVTGGLGSIGLQVAGWLVEQGAKNLMLVSRRPASDSANAAITRLKEAGAIVQIGQADIADLDAIAQVFQTIQTSMPPLKGIFHTAGVTAQNTIQDTSWKDFDTVCRPKVQGTWNLHQLSNALTLDFFVSFSSIASVWGSKGQSAYAAANQFLDSFAHFQNQRQKQEKQPGYRSVAVNWGPWAESGMASDSVKTTLSRMGVNPLPSKPAIEALNRLLSASSTTSQTIVADINWPVFKDLFEANGQQPLLEQIGIAAASEATTPAQSVASETPLEMLQSAPAENRTALLVTYLREQIAKTLSMSPAQLDPDQALNYMGLDSLMAIELKNLIKKQLQVEVPTARFMSGLSVNSLAALVSETLPIGQDHEQSSDNQSSQVTEGAESTADSQADTSPQDATTQQMLDSVDQMNDDEVDSLLQSLLADGVT
ncbi:MAG: type I polyketide synthase [Cyanobacteria bacterium P01_F01_bin.53]